MGNRLSEYIRLVVEARMREADLDSGRKVPWGDDKHVRELEAKIEHMARERDRSPRGSELRGNYARIVNNLKAKLRSARNAAAKRAPLEPKE